MAKSKKKDGAKASKKEAKKLAKFRKQLAAAAISLPEKVGGIEDFRNPDSPLNPAHPSFKNGLFSPADRAEMALAMARRDSYVGGSQDARAAVPWKPKRKAISE